MVMEQLELRLDEEQEPVVGRLLLTVKQAAMMLGIGRTKLYELMDRGLIASVHIDRSVRVPVDEVHAYVRRLRAQS